MSDMTIGGGLAETRQRRLDLRLPPWRGETLKGRYEENARPRLGLLGLGRNFGCTAGDRKVMPEPFENLAGIHDKAFIGVAWPLDLPRYRAQKPAPWCIALVLTGVG